MSQLAFITGATSGIGRATAEALAAKGYRLALAARNGEKLEDTAEDFRMKYNAEVTVWLLDVRDRDAIRATADKVMETCGVPDVLVNDAGLARGLEPYGETAPDDIEQMIDTNIRGLERNSGHIVNLGSTAGLYAYAGAAVYCATKAAVKTFSDGIRIDVIDSDIKVTTIQPGIVQTAFSEVRFHGDKARADAVYEGVDALQAEDIANVIDFVLSQPKRVQISDVVIMANQQATGFMVSKKKKS